MAEWKIKKGNPKADNKPKLPYVGTWSVFSKLDENEKSKLFNAMRAELIASGKMDNK